MFPVTEIGLIGPATRDTRPQNKPTAPHASAKGDRFPKSEGNNPRRRPLPLTDATPPALAPLPRTAVASNKAAPTPASHRLAGTATHVTVVTHDGVFHADEVYACAALSELADKTGSVLNIIRSREQKWFDAADIVVDVGGVYNPDTGRFDHHQKGGAGARSNKVPFSSFGLVWAEVGDTVCGSAAIAKRVDEILVQNVDALDNGVEIGGPRGFTLSGLIALHNPTWLENEPPDIAFQHALTMAKWVLGRVIAQATAQEKARTAVLAAEQLSEGTVLVLSRYLPWQEGVCRQMPKALFVVFFGGSQEWMVQAVPTTLGSFTPRARLPTTWGGLKGEEFERVSGVPGGSFCHIGLHLCASRTKEGAIALATVAVSQREPAAQ